MVACGGGTGRLHQTGDEHDYVKMGYETLALHK